MGFLNLLGPITGITVVVKSSSCLSSVSDKYVRSLVEGICYCWYVMGRVCNELIAGSTSPPISCSITPLVKAAFSCVAPNYNSSLQCPPNARYSQVLVSVSLGQVCSHRLHSLPIFGKQWG